jgi:hypothetical protein
LSGLTVSSRIRASTGVHGNMTETLDHAQTPSSALVGLPGAGRAARNLREPECSCQRLPEAHSARQAAPVADVGRRVGMEGWLQGLPGR